MTQFNSSSGVTREVRREEQLEQEAKPVPNRKCKPLAECANDALDLEVQRQLILLGPAALKGWELDRRGKNKYQIGKKKILIKRNDEGKLVVEQGKKHVMLEEFLQALPEKKECEKTKEVAALVDKFAMLNSK